MEVSNKLIYTLTEVVGILNSLKIRYCLVGGLAVSMLSKPRATEDIDFLILLDHAQKEKLILELEKKFTIIQNWFLLYAKTKRSDFTNYTKMIKDWMNRETKEICYIK